MPKLTRFDEIISNYGHFVVRWRWLILLVSILLAAAAITGTRHLEFKSDYRIWFSAENPQLQAFERLQRMYTKNDNILFVLAPQGGDAFAPEVLAAVEDLTAEAWRLPYAIRVDSISNFQHTEAEQDDLVVADLIEGGEHFDETETARVRDIALAEPALADRLIAEDTAVTAVSVTFQMPELRADEVFETATAARQLAQRIENDYPLIDTYLTGVVMLNTAFPEAAIRDYTTLIPAMYGVIIVTLLLLVRSIAGMIGTVVLIALAAGSAFGLAGYAGIKLSPPAVSALTMIMTLSVADAVHLMMSMRSQMQQGLDKTAALIESLRINFGPIFLTSLTTAIGFASMNFADAPPFRDLGNITATGVMIAFLLSVSFLPAFISICPMRKSKATRMYSGWMSRLANFVIDKRRILLPVMALSSVALLAFIPKNELNDEFVKYFDERIQFRTDTDFAVENLTGIYQIQYSLDTENSNGISDPEFLAQADAFTHWLREQPETVHVSSITDTFKRLNQNMHGDDPDYYRLPTERELAAQYLLLYELSLPFGLDLNNRLSIDKASTQIIATVDNISTRGVREYTARGETWLAENAPDLATTGAGTAVMFSHISQRNIEGMIRGTLLTMFIISMLLIIALRSVKLGLLSLLPNILPAGLAFGLWGLFVGQINMAISVVAAMSLGIVVDDTVHFLSKYLRATRERGLGAEDAIRYAFSTVGMALVITTVILTAGFVVLAQSSFAINNGMAKLTAATIVIALIVDFLLLPPLLIKLDPRRKKKPEQSTETSDEKTAYASSV